MADLTDLAQRIKAHLLDPSLAIWENLENESAKTFSDAVAAGDGPLADKLWFLHKVADTRLQYLKCINQISNSEYYEAWCGLEQVEIALPLLHTNPFYDPNEFAVSELQELVGNWQSVFPYTVFFSPAILEKRKECAICGTIVSPWTNCGHEPGRVYGGKQCFYIVTKLELLEISVVLDPVQKYSVAWLTSDEAGNPVDHYDYSIVRFVAERLASPFHRWEVHWTTSLHPHSLFSDRSPEAGCPCESGRKYSECCLPRPGVIRPHAQILFEHNPPTEMPNAALAGYGTHNSPAIMKFRQVPLEPGEG